MRNEIIRCKYLTAQSEQQRKTRSNSTIKAPEQRH